MDVNGEDRPGETLEQGSLRLVRIRGLDSFGVNLREVFRVPLKGMELICQFVAIEKGCQTLTNLESLPGM